MLVLQRRWREQVKIGNDITISIADISGNTVKLAIDAPSHVRILRGELTPVEEPEPEPTELDLVRSYLGEVLAECRQIAMHGDRDERNKAYGALMESVATVVHSPRKAIALGKIQ